MTVIYVYHQFYYYILQKNLWSPRVNTFIRISVRVVNFYCFDPHVPSPTPVLCRWCQKRLGALRLDPLPHPGRAERRRHETYPL